MMSYKWFTRTVAFYFTKTLFLSLLPQFSGERSPSNLRLELVKKCEWRKRTNTIFSSLWQLMSKYLPFWNLLTNPNNGDLLGTANEGMTMAFWVGSVLGR